MTLTSTDSSQSDFKMTSREPNVFIWGLLQTKTYIQGITRNRKLKISRYFLDQAVFCRINLWLSIIFPICSLFYPAKDCKYPVRRQSQYGVLLAKVGFPFIYQNKMTILVESIFWNPTDLIIPPTFWNVLTRCFTKKEKCSFSSYFF